MAASKKEEKKPKETEKKTKGLEDLKPQRSGVGKYISNSVLYAFFFIYLKSFYFNWNSFLFWRVNKQKLPTIADEEDKAELKSKKLKTGSSSFGDFSAW